MKRSLIKAVALAPIVLFAADPARLAMAQLDRLFFTETGTGYVNRINLDGSGLDRLLFPNYANAGVIRVDPIDAKVYWADSFLNTIYRANLDGSGIERLVHMPGGHFPGLALDTLQRKMYYSHTTLNHAWRANLDGTGQEEIIANPSIATLDVDEVAGHIYFFDNQLDRLQRANLDGTQIVDLVQILHNNVHALTLDTPSGKMYWNDNTLAAIRVANLDGSGVASLPIANVRTLSITIFDGKLYWAQWQTQMIQRSNLDGTQVENLVTTPTEPRGIAVNPFSQTVIWGQFDGLYQANLDGQNPSLLIEETFFCPGQMDLDRIRRHIYWATNNGQQGIYRANYDGSGFEVWPGPAVDASALAIDAGAGHIYWFDQPDMLSRADLDGSNAMVLIPSGAGARDAALDFSGKIYWAEFNAIKRANVDGSGVETILKVNPGGIETDPAGGKIYWTAGSDIARANLDGSDIETLVTKPSNFPWEIVLDPQRDRMYWTRFGGIEYASLDGSNQGILYQPKQSFFSFGMALDATGADQYWLAAWQDADQASCLGAGITVLPMIAYVDNGLACP